MSSSPKRGKYEKQDRLLGTVRFCGRCRDWWPLDSVFWYWRRRNGKVIPQAYCKACFNEALIEHRRAKRVRDVH